MNIHVLYDNSTNINAYWLYTSYYNAIKSFHSDKNVKKYISTYQFDEEDKLYIIDDHYYPNRKIWMDENFIKIVNDLKMRVQIITIEKIYNSYFPDNEVYKKNANKFINLAHISSDAEDSKILNSPVAKQLFSKSFENIKNKFNKNFKEKKNKIIFIGQLNTISNSHWYYNRKQILENVVSWNKYEIDFYQSDKNRSFENYLELISQYKFVINPLGVGNFLSMRYYETLLVNSIPIQQYHDSMLGKYEEINQNGIFFKNKEDLYNILSNMNYQDEYYSTNILNFEYLEEYSSLYNIFKD